MRRTTLFAAAIAALALVSVSVTGALARSAHAPPAIILSPWTGFTVLGAMIALFILEIV